MLKDLLVATTGADGDAAAVAAALNLAERRQAHLTVLVATEVVPPTPSEWGAFPGSLFAELYDDACRRARERADAYRKQLAQASVPVEVRLVEDMLMQPARTAQMHARHADLTLLGNAAAGQSRLDVEHMFVELLTGSGRPLLLVPAQAQPTPFPPRLAVIAWQPTREASRALHDAMPLLHGAGAVHLLMIDPRPGEHRDGAEPGADIATHLARHGLHVTVISQPRMGQSIGAALLRYAFDQGADLLVAGGYGHARLREQILGGVTRDLLASAHLPVLFAH